jgi:pimeloyl-ACP methyl ester carboxylesterase
MGTSRRVGRLSGVTILILVAGMAFLLRPLSSRGLASHPLPAASWEEALARLETLRREDGVAIAPECRTRWMTRGARTGRVIVLLHGLTNCPAQFDSLGRLLFARGANVLIPRLPRHGLADRMTDELGRIDAFELVAFTDRVLDIACGLGDSVTVAGLSIGGTMAAWAGQARADLDRAVPIAPLLGAPRVPPWASPALARLALAGPNLFVWWDPKKRQALGGPKHVYPRFATRSVGASLRIGVAALQSARRSAPGARTLAVVTIGGDPAVNNDAVELLVRSWRRHGAIVGTYQFPRELHLNHDVVDPEQIGGNPALTYPRLIESIDPSSPSPRPDAAAASPTRT